MYLDVNLLAVISLEPSEFVYFAEGMIPRAIWSSMKKEDRSFVPEDPSEALALIEKQWQEVEGGVGIGKVSSGLQPATSSKEALQKRWGSSKVDPREGKDGKSVDSTPSFVDLTGKEEVLDEWLQDKKEKHVKDWLEKSVDPGEGVKKKWVAPFQENDNPARGVKSSDELIDDVLSAIKNGEKDESSSEDSEEERRRRKKKREKEKRKKKKSRRSDSSSEEDERDKKKKKKSKRSDDSEEGSDDDEKRKKREKQKKKSKRSESSSDDEEKVKKKKRKEEEGKKIQVKMLHEDDRNDTPNPSKSTEDEEELRNIALMSLNPETSKEESKNETVEAEPYDANIKLPTEEEIKQKSDQLLDDLFIYMQAEKEKKDEQERFIGDEEGEMKKEIKEDDTKDKDKKSRKRSSSRGRKSSDKDRKRSSRSRSRYCSNCY